MRFKVKLRKAKPHIQFEKIKAELARILLNKMESYLEKHPQKHKLPLYAYLFHAYITCRDLTQMVMVWNWVFGKNLGLVKLEYAEVIRCVTMMGNAEYMRVALSDFSKEVSRSHFFEISFNQQS